jgi:hypothetical protein
VVTFVDILGYREMISAAHTKQESAELLTQQSRI